MVDLEVRYTDMQVCLVSRPDIKSSLLQDPLKVGCSFQRVIYALRFDEVNKLMWS
jgi:hypothetical protein